MIRSKIAGQLIKTHRPDRPTVLEKLSQLLRAFCRAVNHHQRAAVESSGRITHAPRRTHQQNAIARPD